MISQKLISKAIAQSFVVWSMLNIPVFADTCPDMSNTSYYNSSQWYKSGANPLNSNAFTQATWNMLFANSIICYYNGGTLNGYTLTSIQEVQQPTGENWHIYKKHHKIWAECPINLIAACPFTYS